MTQPTAPPAEFNSVAPSPLPPRPNLLPGVLIGILLTSTAVLAYGYFSKNKPSPIVPLPTPPSSPTVSVSPSSAPVDSPFGQITWLKSPQEIKGISLFRELTEKEKMDTVVEFDGTTYSHVGTFSDKSKLIVAFIPAMMSSSYLRIIQTPQNNLYYLSDLKKYSNFETADLKYLLPAVKPLDLDLSGLESPSQIKTSNITFTSSYPSLSSYSNPDAKLAYTTPYGSIYKTINAYKPESTGNNIFYKNYDLKLADGYSVSYSPIIDFISDDGVPKITWSDQSANTQAFNGIQRGCGSGGGAITFVKNNSPLLTDKKEIGKTKSGQPVYQLTNADNILVKTLYDEYKIGRDYPSAPPILPIDQFAQKRNHFLWQDPEGDWVVFISQEYASAAECGKPVIYLYPTQDTVVNVKVGADMSQSDPLYPSDGWTVLASPSGNLTYHNQSYPYLFWEGMGKGIYSDYQNHGVIISQQNLVSTLKSQLSALGLNAKESADFMEFWQPKLPATPYIRLTWLDTADMNRLAPLAVNPRPDTVIRIFLEFEGLRQPRPLIPQILSSVPRRGFTLIEWGGLLIKPRN